ncbi:MAG TPA: gamma-glutamylcyclotransferase [Bordetella sp.]
MPNGIETRLAVYGSLAPGKPNAHVLAALDGSWRPGIVRGRLVQKGWGASMGFPALILDSQGDAVAVQLFESADLAAKWPQLDAFEGPGYRRVPTRVDAAGETVSAYIYVLAA